MATTSSPPVQPPLEAADDSMETESLPNSVIQQSHSPTVPAADEAADELSDIPASPPKRVIAFKAGEGTRSLAPQSTGGLYARQNARVVTASMTGGMFSSPDRAGRTK